MISLRLVIFFTAPLLFAQTSTFDLVISGAQVVDGSGNPWYFADIGIRGDTIAAVGDLRAVNAATRLDARGLVAAPGFIDIHSHGRRGIFTVPTAETICARESPRSSKGRMAVRRYRLRRSSTG
jgi:N-acyl-D-amino-acid deacylase